MPLLWSDSLPRIAAYGPPMIKEELRASTRKLLELVKRERVTLVIFGHDGRQWQTLKRAPDYYE